MFNKISDKFDSMNSVYDGNSIWVNDFDGTSARLVEQKGKIHQRMSEDDSWWNSDCPLVFCFLVSVFCLVIICSILLFENRALRKINGLVAVIGWSWVGSGLLVGW